MERAGLCPAAAARLTRRKNLERFSFLLLLGPSPESARPGALTRLQLLLLLRGVVSFLVPLLLLLGSRVRKLALLDTVATRAKLGR